MNDEELHRLDAQVRAKGQTRASYIRQAVMERIAADELAAARAARESAEPTRPEKRRRNLP